MTAPDALVRTISADGSVSVRVLAATHLVQEAARRHQTSPTATVALGRALMGTLLLASEAQDGERVQVRIRGDGPIGSLLVTASSDGDVRGYATHPDVLLPPAGDRFDVAGAVGLGTLAVERNHPSWKQPYSGVVPLVSGEIARDFAHYLLESEQKPSAVALGVQLGPGGAVVAAGGYLVQALPGASASALDVLERRVRSLLQPSALLRDGVTAEGLLDRLVGGLGTAEVARVEPRFRCPCDERRVLAALTLLGPEELREIAESGESVEVRCAFCAEPWRIAPDAVARLVA
jgi:molecular chaperone Hsp33